MNNKTYFDWTVTGLSLGLAAGAICLIGLSAHAQPGPDGGKRGGGEFLKSADTNGDGNVSLEELQAVRPEMDAERFARMDRNGDGVLNKSDRPEAGQGRRGPGPDGDRGPRGEGRRGGGDRMMAADTNKDGGVSFEELKAVRPDATEEKFAERDTNGDGVLNKDDRPEDGRGPGGKHGKRGNGPEGRRGGGEHMKAADTDGDGGVSFEELKAVRPDATDEMFAKRDTNGDGVLNKDDRPEDARGPGGEHGKRGHGPEGRRGGGEGMKAADTNEDGGVSFEELKAVRPDLTQEDFDARDTNGDGVLNREDGRPARGERRKN